MKKGNTMTISNLTLNRYNSTKVSLATLAQYAIGNYTQQEAFKRARQWIEDFKEKSPKRTPKSIYSNLWAYWDGLTEAAWGGQTIFIYNYKGQFYTTNNDTLPGFFAWDALPREDWDKLGEHGGIYWKSNLTPFSVK